MKMPNYKIELHQWANTILLGIVGFFGVQTYLIIMSDHDRLYKLETRIAVLEEDKRKQERTATVVLQSATLPSEQKKNNKTR